MFVLKLSRAFQLNTMHAQWGAGKHRLRWIVWEAESGGGGVGGESIGSKWSQCITRGDFAYCCYNTVSRLSIIRISVESILFASRRSTHTHNASRVDDQYPRLIRSVREGTVVVIK